jgi:hypothetical protein
LYNTYDKFGSYTYLKGHSPAPLFISRSFPNCIFFSRRLCISGLSLADTTTIVETPNGYLLVTIECILKYDVEQPFMEKLEEWSFHADRELASVETLTRETGPL